MTRQLLTIIAALTLLLAACGDDDDTATDTTDGATEEPSATDPIDEEAGDGGGDDAVSIINFTFEPESIEVSSGTTVTWTNEDGVSHTVTAGTPDATGDAFDQSLDSGASAEIDFDEAGTFPYFCAIHPNMTAEVVVS